MASMREIKRRIRSVNSTGQITKAMKLVSTVKMQKARKDLESTRPFFNIVQKTISSIVNSSKGISHPYLEQREVKKTLYIVMASDRGLAGGYNNNVCKLALKYMEERNKADIELITVGRKAKDFFERRGYKINKVYIKISEEPKYSNAKEIEENIMQLYSEGKVDEVYLVYTSFKSTIDQKPMVKKLLPVDTSDFQEESQEQRRTLMIYEPSPESVLEYIIPKYIASVIYGAMFEAAASEQGARMTAMDSATKNAEEIIDNLTLHFNRARQAAITQEITEVVSGAEALK